MVEHRVPKSEASDSLDQLLAASIAVFDLHVKPEWRKEARFFLGVVAESARLVARADLADCAEPAAVYHP